MNLIYKCFQHENLAKYICLDNGCTQKLICDQCVKKYRGIFRAQDQLHNSIYQTIQQHNPVKIENFCENLLYVCEENASAKEHLQLNKISIIKSMEGKDQYYKLQIFKEKMEQKKSDMEDKYIKQIMKQLASYGEDVNQTLDRIHQNTKFKLDHSLNELISQECLIRQDYKVQAAKQVLNCIIKNNQQELNDMLIDFHQGTIELASGTEQFTLLMNQFQQEIKKKFENVLEVIADLAIQLDNNLHHIFEKLNKQNVEAQHLRNQKQITIILENQFKELIESTRNIKIQKINSDKMYLFINFINFDRIEGNFQFYTNILEKYNNLDKEEDEITEERQISEGEWHDIMSRIRQMSFQEKNHKNLMIKQKTRHYSPNNNSIKQRNKHAQLQLQRSVKKFQDFQDISSLLYFPKEQKKKDSIFITIKELKEKKNLANTFDQVEQKQTEQKKDCSFQLDSYSKLELDDNIIEMKRSKFYIIFNSIQTLIETQKKLTDLQIENIKIDNILKKYFLQLDLKDKVIFKVHRIIDLVFFSRTKIVLGRQDGIIEVWRMRNILTNKKFERMEVITGELISLKYLIQLNTTGLIMTYGQDESKEYILKIWAFQFNDKLQVVYTVKKLHKGPIQDLIALEQKQSGLFPNNIYNKEAGSCGAIYFSSFSKNDGVKIWKIFYFGGKISESKISNIMNLPIKSLIKMNYKQESIILLSKGQLIKIIFNDLFDKIKDQIVQLIPSNDEYFYSFGQNRIIIGVKKGEIYIYDYELKKISMVNFINQFLTKYIDDQQKSVNKFQRNEIETSKKMPKTPYQCKNSYIIILVLENEKNVFVIEDINSFQNCTTCKCLINVSNLQYFGQEKVFSKIKERKKIEPKQQYEKYAESVIFDVDNLKILGMVRSYEEQEFNPNIYRLLSLDHYLIGVDKEQKEVTLWEQNPNNEISI